MTESFFLNPYPYLIITHTCVVCLSEDGASAMLLQAQEQIGWYRRFFDSLIESCYSLITYTGDPLAILSSYQKCTESDGFYMIMDQPCLPRLADRPLRQQPHLHTERDRRGAGKAGVTDLMKKIRWYCCFAENFTKIL